jgi:hypothetical protein
MGCHHAIDGTKISPPLNQLTNTAQWAATTPSMAPAIPSRSIATQGIDE